MKINLKDIPVIYINLDRDKEKNATMKKMLSKLKFKNVHRIPGIIANIDHDCEKEHPEFLPPEPCIINKYYGCSMAHVAALEYANHNYPDSPVLILEDDCILINKIDSLEIPDNADALYVGIGNGGMSNVDINNITIDSKKLWKNCSPEFILGDKISRIFNMGSAHAILYMNNRYRSLAIEMCNLAIKHSTLSDILLTAIQPDNFVYGLNKPVFAQSGVFLHQTDVTLDIIDSDIKLGINDHV